jgi:hypothetical protein
LDCPIYAKLLEAMDDPCYYIRKEAIIVVKNITSNQDLEVILNLFTNGTVGKLFTKLDESHDKEITLNILNIIIDILCVSKYLEESAMNDYVIKNEIEKLNGNMIVQKFTVNEDSQISNAAIVVAHQFNNVQQIS